MLVKQMENNAGQTFQADPAGAVGAGKSGADALKPVQSALPSASGASGTPTGAWATTPSAAPADTVPRAGDRKQRFLEALRSHAEAAEAETGVPARFILAQAALESGWGEREIKDAQGQSSHNLFGVKAGRNWDGAAVETTTTEYRQGISMKQTQRFRAYADYGEAFTDYANLLKNRFGDAVNAGNDAEGFAKGLADGGYATDPAYAGKLKAVIASVAMAGS
jgi:flagellar protein FlgJ